MARPRVLYVCHNHPRVRPGGAEAYAYELFRAMAAADEFEPIFLAKGGPPVSETDSPHPGTLFAPVAGSKNEYFFYTDGYSYDWLYGSITGKDFYTRHFRDFLLAFRPSIVHFQHTLHLGFDLIRETRNTLPEAAILYTLHEFLPICHRNGQMVRTVREELCAEESPARCHECFPGISPESFFMRKRFIQSHFALVDQFLAPSRFLMERFIEWGIPREKISFEDYGRLPVAPAPEQGAERPRNRLGFFGQFTPFKGAHVLLKAMQILLEDGAARNGRADESKAHLWLFGANLDWQTGTYQNEFRALVEATSDTVTLVGRYTHDELPKLMAGVDWVVVPSIWWENSPLVIQEAFLHKRPVICSDIGGMAEKVTDGVDGLYFRVGDAESLAQTIRQAVTTPGLWQSLRDGIKQVYGVDEHLKSLSGIYRSMLERVAAER